MLRKLPLVLAFIFAFFIVSAQNNCPTCSNGTNSNVAAARTITNTQNIELLARNHPRVAPVPVYNTINVAPSIGLLNVCGLNWTAASVLTETRSISILSNTNGTGFPTTMTIGGIPANCYQIEQAYLYYEASYTEAVAPVTTATFTNPALATATLPSTIVATGPQKCWGEVGTATYRVDVTANIAGNGNYSVNLNGFANAGYEVDGCTLIIVYIAGPTNSTTGNFALFDGDEVDNSSTVYSNIISFPAPCTATTAQAFVVIADAQAQAQPTHTDDFNAVVGTFNNNFWNFDQVNVPFTVATTSVTDIAYANNSADCWAWILEGLYWQNTGCTNCLPIITTSQVNPPCNGGVGSITATVTNGTPPYTYTWSNGGTNNSINGITAGTYTLTVEDVICNTAQVQVTLTQPPPLTAFTTGTNSACGNGTGTATVTAGGGTGPYIYSWNPSGQTNATATGLSSGSYTVTVTDAHNCTTTAVQMVTSTGGITPTMGPNTNELCNGGNNANATVTVAGGTAPYTYAWTPTGGTNATGTGLTAGTYTVNVTDANGCTGTATVTITQPVALVPTMGAPTNVLCNGGTGSATVAVAGGTAPYTYFWTPNGGTNATGTGLTAGSYTVNVSDANGCANSAIVTITQPAPLTANTTMTQAVCGNANGTATVVAGGGTAPYVYSWNPSGQTNATATGLSGGSYTVTVTDNNACTTTSVILVTSTPGITVTMGANTNDLCNGGNNATATVNVAGGNAPYTYAWAPIGGTNATGTGLLANTYTVTVTDANGCTGTATVVITEPTALVATMGAPTDASCNGASDGSATVTVTGGTGPYTYSWMPAGGTNARGTGLSAGNYTVNITDNNGCPTMATVIIGQPAAINIITTTVSANCNQSNGSATATVTGGVGAYTYSWNPTANTNSTVTGLSANSYTVTVTDADGCTQTATAVVNNLGGETATMGAITNVSCFNGANGTATVNVVGGTGPYTYSWAPSGQTNATATGLSANSYVVTVTDANGCTSIANATITQPTLLVATMGAPTNILCAGGTGSATVTVTGGTGPYAYVWAPAGGTNAMGTGLTANTYTVTITDANGCTATSTVTITSPATLTAAITATNNVSCSGGNNGSLAVTAGGGAAPYTYAWTPTGGSNAIANGLTAGIYTITVTDANGCTATASGTINQPNAITVTTTSTQTSCQPTGTATATAAGGTAPYTYKWTPSNQTNSTATALAAGTYTITVTDNNGCTQTATATVTSLNAVTATMGAIVNVTCFGGKNGTATVTAASGTAPYTYAWAPTGGAGATGTGLSAGTYTVTVTDNSGCTATASATIVQPNAMLVTATGTSSVCSGQTATLNAIITGGTAPYTYAWTPAGGAGSTASVIPLTTTTYTITVTDANGCTANTTITVNVNPVLTLVVSGSTAICPGSTATFTATGSGGDGNYTYLWSNGAHTQTISVAPSSTEVLTVTLSDGCGSTPLTVPVIVTVDPLPVVKFQTENAKGCAPLCVQFRDLTTISSGGINNWIWYFGDGDSSSSRYPLYCYNSSGNYDVTLTVVSDSGCSSTLRILNLISVYNHPNASFTYTPDPVTIFTPQVQFQDNSNGTYPIMEWLWSFGDKTDSISTLENPSHTYQDTGTFCTKLQIMDINGCIDTITECIDVEPLFTFYIPDAFSPNSDGINDVFMPKGSYIKTYEMFIFDRWGMKLFHSTDIFNGWDGTVNGGSTISQEDTYVYLIKVTDTQGTDHSYVGKVNLVK